MDKHRYYLKALTDTVHAPFMRTAWVMSLFSEITEDPEAYRQDPYPYRVVRSATGEVAFVDPDQDGALTPLDDAPRDGPLFRFRERLILQPREILNYTGKGPLDTTYGNALVNQLVLVLPFGDKIPFQTGHVAMGKIEDELLARLVDDPQEEVPYGEPGFHAPDGQIYIREYLRFCDHALSLVAYSPIAVTSVTPKSLMGHPEARQRRASLIAENEGKLNDPAVVAKIGKALEELDREWLSDDPAMDFYGTKAAKYFGGVRNKLYYMFGGSSAFSEGTTTTFLPKSLEEGIDPSELPAMINSLREGSYKRGSQTQLGGETTKTIYRMLGTIRIAEPDCETTVGLPLTVTPARAKELIGYWVIDGKRSVQVTTENHTTFVGKEVMKRTPLTCKTEGRNVCARCIGESLAEQPMGLPAAAANIGGKFLTSMLKSMHSAGLKTTPWSTSGIR